uniref:vitellin-degrading protease-like isoform X1 n=1 Tax=Myxine glutinosa TaxID=7769 RepID=UPI003590061C
MLDKCVTFVLFHSEKLLILLSLFLVQGCILVSSTYQRYSITHRASFDGQHHQDELFRQRPAAETLHLPAHLPLRVIPVIHGTPVMISDVPWQALIKFRSERRNFGGGGLIGPRFLLTAAHVVRKSSPSDIQVTVGMTTQRKHEGILVDVEKVILHPGYNPSGNGHRGNDIAILWLKEPVTESTNVKYIDLPPNLEASPVPGTAALVSGWGRTMKRMRSQSLMAAIVPIASRNACIEAYTNRYDTELQIPIALTADMLCAGTGKENEPYACQGDSGSVLGVPGHNGSFWAGGLVSFGLNCGKPGLFGIYTDVAAHISWIKNVTLELSSHSSNPSSQPPVAPTQFPPYFFANLVQTLQQKLWPEIFGDKESTELA